MLGETAAAWQRQIEDRTPSPIESVRVRAMTAHVTAEAVTVVDRAYTVGGSVSLYSTSRLQRRLRDVHVTTQHMAATTDTYRFLGALLVGEPVPPQVLARI